MKNKSSPARRTASEKVKRKVVGSGDGFGNEPSAKLWAAMQLKADMFDYICWLEDFCQFRQAALDGKGGDYLVLASDGTTCWGKTYAEAVRVAMEEDKQIFDATQSLPNHRLASPDQEALSSGWV